MITQEDLNWWLEFAHTREWTFAKTYAETAPHHYVVEGRTPGVTHEDMVRAARVICTFGTPAKYYSLTKIYLESPDGRYRWWTEDHRFTDTTLVNRASTDRFYGVQNALSTTPATPSAFDGLATTWDAEHPLQHVDRVKDLLAPVRGAFPPHVLDVGCGTGGVLDLGIAAPERYVGVDASRAMLNVLIRKHPRVAAVHPTDIRTELDSGTFTPGQFDWVFVDAAVALDTSERELLHRIARLAVIQVGGDDWAVTDVRAASTRRIIDEGATMKGLT